MPANALAATAARKVSETVSVTANDHLLCADSPHEFDVVFVGFSAQGEPQFAHECTYCGEISALHG